VSSSESPSTELASDALFTQVYARLKAMAGRHRARSGPDQTLCTTELVHEAYLRMGSASGAAFADQAQFFAYAARAMRSILVDLARQRMQLKKGGGQARLSLDDPGADVVAVDPALALTLDAALRALEADDERAARVVELHFFAGLPLADIATLLQVGSRTIDRDWRYARAFLAAQASGDVT
jgi:RNA polymerase sigma factor (TIGR02999 family)